jgi:replicative DNA helicase
MKPENITELELQAPDSEQALIGAVAFHPDALAGILARLPGSDFYDLPRGIVWDTCRALSSERQPITPTTVARRLLSDGNWSAGTQRVVQMEMPNSASAVFASKHADAVADLAERRKILRALTHARVLVATHPGDASDVLAATRSGLDDLDRDTEDKPTAGTLSWPQLVDEFEQAHAPGNATPGIPSPWFELDEILGGLHPGRMYTIGGRPGAGKSTAALVIAEHAATESSRNVLVFSKEMPTVDVTGRFIARGAQVDLRAINHHPIDDVQMARVREYLKRVGTPHLHVNASPVNLSGIKTLTRAHHHRHGLDVLVVDYLQLVHTDSPGRTREQEVGRVSRELKALAMELGLALVVPAQLNRGPAGRQDSKPTMSDLRDSGQIEQDSDAVILLWHQLNDGQPTGEVTFIVDKNRHGPKGEIKLRWHGGYGAIG